MANSKASNFSPGPARLEIEVDFLIDPIDSPLIGCESTGVEVFASQSRSRVGLHEGPKAADEVGDGGTVLPDGQAREVDSSRAVAGLRIERVKRLVHIFRDSGRIGPDTRARVVLRHRFLDHLRQTGRPICRPAAFADISWCLHRSPRGNGCTADGKSVHRWGRQRMMEAGSAAQPPPPSRPISGDETSGESLASGTGCGGDTGRKSASKGRVGARLQPRAGGLYQ